VITKIVSYLRKASYFTPLLLLSIQSVHAQDVKDWASCSTEDGIPTLKCLEVVMGNLLTISSALIVLVLFIMFIIGSFSYLTSGGNPEKTKKARATLTYAIIGTILFACSFLIIKTVDVLFLGGQGKLFNFTIDDVQAP
jgi:hypothetical protein